MSEIAEAVATATTGDPVLDRLTASFAREATPTQVDNSSETEEVAKVVEEEVKTEEPAKVEEEEKTESEKTEEAKSEDEETEDDTFDYPESEDDLKTKWPRAVPLKIVKQAAQWASEAKEGKETETSLGGKHYIVPLTKISGALQDPDAPMEAFQPFFEGIVEAAGDDALRKVLGQSVYIAVVQGPAWQENPATKEFGDELHTIVDAALQSRFGVNTETLLALADWQGMGAFDELNKFIETEFLDDDKDFDEYKFLEASKKFYNELRELQHNPKLKATAKENLELKRQLEEKKATVKETPVSDNSFHEHIDSVVDTVMPKVIFAKSPLAELATDTPEMKELKSDFRENITDKVKASIDKSKLIAWHREGKQTTAFYQEALTRAVNDAIDKANPVRQRAEKMVAELYSKTRNGKLLAKQEPKIPEAPLEPTKPTEFAPKTAQTPREIEKVVMDRLTNAYAREEANR